MSAARAFRPPCSSARSTLIGPRIGVLYGMTEAPVSCYLPPRALEPEAVRGRLIDSVGRVLADYEVRIADADENAPSARTEPARC